MAVNLLGQQGINHFIRKLYQWNFPLGNAVINFIQVIQAEDYKEGDQDRKESVQKEHPFGNIQVEKTGYDRLREKPCCKGSEQKVSREGFRGHIKLERPPQWYFHKKVNTFK
jgi:hypothetical protein